MCTSSNQMLIPVRVGKVQCEQILKNNAARSFPYQRTNFDPTSITTLLFFLKPYNQSDEDTRCLDVYFDTYRTTVSSPWFIPTPQAKAI